MERVDVAIQEIERFYRALTGREMPVADGGEPLPPERDPVKHVEEQLERLVRALSGGTLRRPVWVPAASIAEDEAGYAVSVDLPGVERDEVEVIATGNRLEIRGRREARIDGQLRATDRAAGEFRRMLTFPTMLEAERLHAHLREGVLEIRVPRAGRVGIRTVPVQ